MNQQPNQSSKISKNTWLMIAAIVITGLIVGASVYTWQRSAARKSTEALQQQINNLQNQIQQLHQNRDTADPTANWKTYRNEVLGFEIKYPESWQIKSRNTITKEALELTNQSVSEKPKFMLWVNPEGFGLTPPDIIYKLALDNSNGIKIIERTEIPQTLEGMSNIDGQTVISCKTTRLGNNSYILNFSSKEGGQDYEPTLKQILFTFKLIEASKVEIKTFLIANSFNLSSKTFEAITTPGQEKIKVATTAATKFYRLTGLSENKEYFNSFSEFASVAKGISSWPLTIKGSLSSSDEEITTIIADEVLWVAQ